MSPEQTHVFELLDVYAKDHYECFVAEMSLNEARGRYTVCFRPTGEFNGDPNPYLCRYLYIDMKEVETSHKNGRLTNAIVTDLHDQLSKIKSF